jgi:iron complex transport system substrate-binding protein
VDELNMITGAVIAAGVRIHRKLGPGLLESVYEVVLARDLVRLGFIVERQKGGQLRVRGNDIRGGFSA